MKTATTTLLAVIAALGITTACTKPRRTPAPTSPTTAPVVATRDAGNPSSTAPTTAPAAPSTWTDAADTAVAAKDWDELCVALEFAAFDPTVCAWLARKARDGISGPPNPRVLEAFLRRHRVSRTSGSIVALLEERRTGDTYEARIRGRVAFLETAETTFSTTGRFTLWTQQQDDQETTMMSGAVRDVPVYMEWPLAELVLDVARARGTDAQRKAELLFGYLADSWNVDRSLSVDIPAEDAWPAWREARRTGTPSGAGIDAGVAPPAERVEACRRACSMWRSCMRDMSDTYYCQDEMTRACRECRDQGLGR